jgi:acetyl-CoA synthetase/medium-chain acyl-CoA synthetase
VIESNLLEKLSSSERLRSLAIKISVGEPTNDWLDYHSARMSAPIEHECVDTGADENAICYFTSGTTGYAKMSIHTHASSGIGHEITGKYWLNLKQGDISWCITDTGWAKIGFSALFGPWRMGSTVFVVEEPTFNPDHTINILQTFPIHVFCAPPTVYRILVQNDISGLKDAQLRDAVSAGEPLNAEVINTWKDSTAIGIREGYGQTETVIICASFPGVEIRPGSMGKSSPGIDLDVVDDDGNEVELGLEGNIAIRVKPTRPLGLFKEYRNNPEKTAEAFRGDWYYTGDRAYKDEDGYFWFVSRADDVIISSGYRIGPFEVESALQEHPAVLETAVVSSPDDTRGEVVKAFVILAPGFNADDELVKTLQDFVKSITAPYKYPRKIEFVTELPKTISGKTRRVELREKEWRK